ncbi:unnamed protein product [Rhizopus stolonifer]
MTHLILNDGISFCVEDKNNSRAANPKKRSRATYDAFNKETDIVASNVRKGQLEASQLSSGTSRRQKTTSKYSIDSPSMTDEQKAEDSNAKDSDSEDIGAV